MSRLLSSLLVAATLAGLPMASVGAAAAGERVARTGDHSASVLLVQDRGRWDDHRRYERSEWRDRRDRDHRDHRDGCGPRQAVRKAERMGVRGADIERVGRRSVTVSGWRRGEPTFVRFAQAPGCPVLDRR